MHLGSDFADPKFARNLLVHEARRDQAKYLLFTVGQCFETSTRLENRTFLDATVTIARRREDPVRGMVLLGIQPRPPSWHEPSSGYRRIR